MKVPVTGFIDTFLPPMRLSADSESTQMHGLFPALEARSLRIAIVQAIARIG
jgi:hypothetical protein